jgi:HlyD family secretion protein
MKIKFIILTTCIAISACSGNKKKADAYGNFEAVEVMVSSETQGKLLQFNAEEGQQLKAGEQVAVIDTVSNFYRKQQFLAQKEAATARLTQVKTQIDVQNEQYKNLQREKQRIDKLVADKAAPEKQLDDINNQLAVTNKQIVSIQSQNQAIAGEIRALQYQVAQIQDLLHKSIIQNPINGVVLEKYVENNELVVPGKVLYKIANLSVLKLRVYISGTQLPHIKLGQQVTVLIDNDKNSNTELTGKISWISQQAEFTPKIIQTKEERVNLVYAVKIDVPNNGSLKIGMPGEVVFKNTN